MKLKAILIICLLCLYFVWQSSTVQAQACGFPATVSNAVELNAAIACFNAATTPGEYVITLANDIPLTLSTTTINNATAGVTLRIDGASFTVDGQDSSGERPFEIRPDTIVAMQVITITGGNVNNLGGGIYNAGTLTLTNSTISGNEATDGYGGGIFNNSSGAVTINNSTVSGNRAGSLNGDGGGIYNEGALTINNSTVSGNTSDAIDSGGGGIFSNNTGEVTINNSTVSGNSTMDGHGGGIYNIGEMALSNSTISGNSTIHRSGGGIHNVGALTINNSTVRGNSSLDGGGIFNNDSGELIISNSTFSENSAVLTGGGIFNSSALSISISNSTFSDNSSGDGGGGILNFGALSIINSTFSDNSAPEGGALYISSDAAVLTLANTILANSSSGGDCIRVSGTINASHSLIEDGLACVNGTNTNNLTGDPLLGPLQANGGATFTHALLPGSKAIDAGDNVVCADPTTVNNLDQRGITRPQGITCDIGAFEAVPTPQPGVLIDTCFGYEVWQLGGGVYAAAG